MTKLYLIAASIIFDNVLFSDAPENFQMSIQDPVTPALEGMLEFHHYLMFCMILVGIFGVWVLLEVFTFDQHKNLVPQKFTPASTFEILWIILRAILVTWRKKIIMKKLTLNYKIFAALVLVFLFCGECYFFYQLLLQEGFFLSYQSVPVAAASVAPAKAAAGLPGTAGFGMIVVIVYTTLTGDSPPPVEPVVEPLVQNDADKPASWGTMLYFFMVGPVGVMIFGTAVFVPAMGFIPVGIYLGHCARALLGFDKNIEPEVAATPVAEVSPSLLDLLSAGPELPLVLVGILLFATTVFLCRDKQ